MPTNDIALLVGHPERLNRSTLFTLRQVVARYPWFETARLLLLDNLYLLHDPDFSEELRHSVLYVHDRRTLCRLIDTLSSPITDTVLLETSQDVEPEPTVDRTMSLIDAFLGTLPDLPQTLLPETPVSTDYMAMLSHGQTDEASLTDLEILNIHTPVEPPTVAPPTAEPPAIAPPTAEQPTIAPPTIAPPTIEPPTIEPPSVESPAVEPPAVEPPAIEPPAIEPPAVESPTNSHRSGSFLNRLQPPTLPDPAKPAPVALETPAVDEMPTGQSAPAFPQKKAVSKGSNEAVNPEFFTETLARIYIRQKKYDRALEIIRSLYLNYPEKNIYFADQIRFLERLVKNNNLKNR